MSTPSPSPGLQAVRAAADRLGVSLPALVAEVGLWVPPEVHARHVSPTNPTGAVYPNVRRVRVGEKAGDVIDGVRLDRNNYAGAALREALGGRGRALAGYQACHVWPATCYDPRYHTALANLVLVPAPLVSLTDHDPDVMSALQFRSFELYGWHPLEVAPPARPACYPTRWLAPRAATSRPERRVIRDTATAGPRPDGEGQRVVMRRLWKRHGGDKEAILRDAAEALRTGAMRRKNNRRNMSAEEYAYRLWLDGTKKGWLG